MSVSRNPHIATVPESLERAPIEVRAPHVGAEHHRGSGSTGFGAVHIVIIGQVELLQIAQLFHVCSRRLCGLLARDGRQNDAVAISQSVSYFTIPPRAHPTGSQSGSATPGRTQVPSTRSRGLLNCRN